MPRALNKRDKLYAKSKMQELSFDEWLVWFKEFGRIDNDPTEDQLKKLKLLHEIVNSPLAKAMREIEE